MKQTVRTYGRMELAQAYFPAILPRSAWKKLKALLMDDPQTILCPSRPSRPPRQDCESAVRSPIDEFKNILQNGTFWCFGFLGIL